MAPDDNKTRTHVPLINGTMVSHYQIIERICAGACGDAEHVHDSHYAESSAVLLGCCR